jgi:hypothetical protein
MKLNLLTNTSIVVDTWAMKSKIQSVTPRYTKFENILPDELSNVKITEDSSRQNKAIPFNEFLKPPSIIKAAFYIKQDDSQDPVIR